MRFILIYILMNNEWPMSEAEISSHTSRISWFKSSFDNFSCHGSFFINSFTWLYIRLAYYSFILIILSYHRQFPSYPFFVFSFLCLIILNYTKPWMMKYKLLQARRCESLFLFHLERRQLVAHGFMLLMLGLVVK